MMPVLAQAKNLNIGDFLEVIFFLIIVVLPALGAWLRKRSANGEPDEEEALRKIIEEERRKMGLPPIPESAAERPAPDPGRGPAMRPKPKPARPVAAPPPEAPTEEGAATLTSSSPPPSSPSWSAVPPPPAAPRRTGQRPTPPPAPAPVRRVQPAAGASARSEAKPTAHARPARAPRRLEEELRTRQLGSRKLGELTTAPTKGDLPDDGASTAEKPAVAAHVALSLEELRRAVILSEVLSPPLALRGERWTTE